MSSSEDDDEVCMSPAEQAEHDQHAAELDEEIHTALNIIRAWRLNNPDETLLTDRMIGLLAVSFKDSVDIVNALLALSARTLVLLSRHEE